MSTKDLDPSAYGEADRREVDRRSKWMQPHGQQAANSIGGSENGKSGGAGCAVETAVNGGSELLIFVLQAAHSATNDLWRA